MRNLILINNVLGEFEDDKIRLEQNKTTESRSTRW